VASTLSFMSLPHYKYFIASICHACLELIFRTFWFRIAVIGIRGAVTFQFILFRFFLSFRLPFSDFVFLSRFLGFVIVIFVFFFFTRPFFIQASYTHMNSWITHLEFQERMKSQKMQAMCQRIFSSWPLPSRQRHLS